MPRSTVTEKGLLAIEKGREARLRTIAAVILQMGPTPAKGDKKIYLVTSVSLAMHRYRVKGCWISSCAKRVAVQALERYLACRSYLSLRRFLTTSVGFYGGN